VFVRYIPEIGRAYTGYNSNDLMFVGVATHKNTLGALLMVSSFFLAADQLSVRRKGFVILGPFLRLGSGLVLLMAVWLLVIANSATSLVCTILGVSILLASGFGAIRRRLRFVEVFVVLLAAGWFLLDYAFGITESAVQGLGRDMTFTGRSDAWQIVLSSPINPLFGAGFKSFWAGERMEKLWETLPHIVQAHNGYVETYLNGGLLGLLILMFMMVGGFAKIKQRLMAGDGFARVQFAFWIVALVYNLSESAFNNLFLVWFTTLLVVAELPSARQPVPEASIHALAQKREKPGRASIAQKDRLGALRTPSSMRHVTVPRPR
jgi:O-antigen ligase